MFWQFFTLLSRMFWIWNWIVWIIYKFLPFAAFTILKNASWSFTLKIFKNKLSFHPPLLIIHISLWLMWKFIGHVECWQIVLTAVNQFQSRTRGKMLIFYFICLCLSNIEMESCRLCIDWNNINYCQFINLLGNITLLG